MFYDFLKECSAVLEEEMYDYESVLRRFAAVERTYTGLMPSIVEDLYPIYALECTSANRFVKNNMPQVYFVPIEGHGDWAISGFNHLINNFYDNDEIDNFYREYYGASLEEIIILRSKGIEDHLTLSDGTGYCAAFCHLTMPNRIQVFVIILSMKPEDCWTQVMEKYDIPCDILIDSHKGMGDWFYRVPLCSAMKNSPKTELLPKYYFCGKYSWGGAPEEFEEHYTIPEEIFRANEYDKIIYLTKW